MTASQNLVPASHIIALLMLQKLVQYPLLGAVPRPYGRFKLLEILREL